MFGTMLAIHGQVVNQDAEGKSTIVFPGGTIGIDIGETALSFNFMNIQYTTEDGTNGNSPKGFILGVNARTENKSGIGKLFESGKVVPGSSLLVTFGYLWENKNYLDMAKWEKSDQSRKNDIMSPGNVSHSRYVIFTRIGASAGSFKSYTPLESSEIKDQFEKIEYSSLSIQIGANIQLGKGMLLGFAAGFQKDANNLETLKKKEFTLNTTQSSEDQKLVEEEKIIAYSGEFKKFDRLDIDSDIVGFVKVGKTHVMTPYGYFRWRIPIGAGDSFAKTMNIGLGANFFTEKGKHLGGIFIELPDLTNELKDDRKLLNRLTLGITVKITFAKSNSWIPWLK